jgi:UDP-N-acetylglucosamine--N-acetylmuramyl-(pentapeptide) pyrophosphoryl-undecaprenol N-acetylglucosamine transferase
VLVPYPAAADDHQTCNARIFQRAGAAKILVESKATPEDLFGQVAEILTNTELRRKMADAAAQLASEDAARRVAEEIEASCNRN